MSYAKSTMRRKNYSIWGVDINFIWIMIFLEKNLEFVDKIRKFAKNYTYNNKFFSQIKKHLTNIANFVMKKIFFCLFVILSVTCVQAQNKYSYKDVMEFKRGLLYSAREMAKSVPIQINEVETLYAIGVMNNLVVYKSEIAGWDGNILMTKAETEQVKSGMILNMRRMWQQDMDMFKECLRRTKLEFQFMFFSEDRKYIGGFKLGYKDFLNK